MINKAGRPRSIVRSDAEIDPEASSELAASEEESGDSRRGIFLRLTSDAKETLESAKELIGKGAHGPKTYAGVIEKLLEYYERQAFAVKENILRGIPSSPLKESEDLLARLQRAQHAFETKRFYFAIKTYSKVAKGLTGAESSNELLDVCRFRLAHSWNQLSYTLRAEALNYDQRLEDAKAQTERLYALAGRALDMALNCLKKMKDENDELMALIKNYNMACCFSLKAQYMVEASLQPNEPPGDLMRDAWNERKKTEELWATSIGLLWKRVSNEAEVREAAEKALDWLRRISLTNRTNSSQSRSSKEAKTISESVWVVNEANDDPDFLFLRSAEEFKREFVKWRADALKGASIAVAIEDLLDEEQVP